MARKQTNSSTRNKNISLISGKIFVSSTFNNTIITITDDKGNTVFTGSTGRVGFKGSRKSTPYAATTAITQTVDQAKEAGLKQARLYIKGPGVGRDAALRVLKGSGIKLIQIADVTPIPHNGCRAKKQRHG
jgi:small subunit ribosomal protein S11